MTKTKIRNSLFAIRYSIIDIQYLIRASILFFIIVTMFASNTFAQTTANFSYDSTYGGLSGYQTPDSAQVNITRNGFGRHPVEMAYDNTKNSITTTYNFQDNAAGRRVVQKRTSGGVTTTSHFLFGGGLRPKVEFRNDGTTTTAHYTIYGPGGRVVSYITTDSSGSPVRLTPIHDRLGSTRALIDSSSGGSGNVEARFGYNTLGKPTETDGCTTECDQYREYPYRFQGHRYLPFEDETATAGYTVGVTDNVDRLYSHDHGMRFMHTDLAGQSISPYTAYGNDPVNMVDITGLHPIDEYLSRLVNDYNITGIWVADVHAIATMADLAADLIDAGIGTGLALEDFSMKHAYYGLVENRNNIWSTEKNASTDRTMKESRIARYNAEERLYDMAFRQFNKIEKFGGEKSGKGVFEGIDKIWSEQTLPIFFSGVNHPVRIDQGTNMMDSAYNHLGQNDILLRIKFTDLIKSVKKPSFLNANKNLVYERMKSDQEHWEKAWSKEVKQGKNYWNQLKLKQLASKGFQDQLGNRFEVEVWSRTDFSLSRQQSIQNVSSANNNVSRDYRPINNYSHMHNLNENNVIAENQGTGYRYGRTIRPIPFEAFYE